MKVANIALGLFFALCAAAWFAAALGFWAPDKWLHSLAFGVVGLDMTSVALRTFDNRKTPL